MPKFKVLSGDELIHIFGSLGFEVASQKGSHVKLYRITKEGVKQTLTIPCHKELDRGTIHAIYRQALRYISESDLQSYFYFG
ncbi:MAG: type II toxin-antitoxin system HicA family toxin [Candidatus Niyogibacteria bacterium]|nr:type II toxin-antitoxin system HicA family toxin [Candidatus Niyogibacteria bacterium]